MLADNVDLTNARVIVTGAAGFIGANLSRRLLAEYPEITVYGIDNMNDYYDVHLKEARLAELTPHANFHFIRGDIADRAVVDQLFADALPDVVVNLAAQAGVRYSIVNPDAYIQSNLIGFYNILEACRHSYDAKNRAEGTPEGNGPFGAGGASEDADGKAAKAPEQSAEAAPAHYEGYRGVRHLVYASSSSVYGANRKVPFSTDDPVDHPVSLYAATKKSDELLAHAYTKLYGIPSTGLRFFTVYGPAGRPDMALFGFTDKLRKGKTIEIFNYGHCKRDFTYIDDIVTGVVRVMRHYPDVNEFGTRYTVYNIGNNHPEDLLEFVRILEQEMIRQGILPADFDFDAHTKLVPMQPGDVETTYADTSALERDYGFRPSTDLRDGVSRFIAWYKEYYL